MKNNLKIVNIVFSGRMPFKHKLKSNEVKRLIYKGNLKWMVINEETSPIIVTNTLRKSLNVHKRKKRIHISIWTTGAIIIVGVRSRKESNKAYDLVMKDIKNYVKEF